MEQAIIDLITLIKSGLETPILNALNNTTPFTQLISFVNTTISAVFKLFNNDNGIAPTISNELIAELLATIVLIYLFWVVIKIFKAIRNAIEQSFTPLTPSQKVSNKIKKYQKKVK